MSETKPGIFLILEFKWPQPFQDEHGKLAWALHNAVQGQSWIRESVAASGGVGGKQPSMWIFWLENYAALDRLFFKEEEDPVSKAFKTFFSKMLNVEDYIREEVLFL